MTTFIYGNYSYEYEIIKQDRKSISLTVKPDKSLVLKCPESVDQERIDLFLKRKWSWMHKQLTFFDRIKKQYKREYVSGESFYYLGRQYKLLVKKAKEDKVVLSRGALIVHTSSNITDQAKNKKLVDSWYKKRAEIIFTERFNEVKKRFDYSDMPTLKIRNMSRRWGSFVGDSQVVLNPKLIHTSKKCIDYVIAHELCHVKHKNHDKKFWKFLSTKSPNWEKIKDELESKFGGY